MDILLRQARCTYHPVIITSRATFQHHQQHHQPQQSYIGIQYSGYYSLPSLAHTASRCRRAYILPLWFFLFSTPNLWGDWTDLLQTWTHIHIWQLFEKFGPNPPGHIKPWAGGKKRFFGTNFELWQNMEHIFTTEHDINNRRKIVNVKRLRYMPLNLVNFGPERSENGWRVFAHPLNFHIGGHCQPYCMGVI